jgi:uncharacterized protein (DUF2147 family)
MPSLIASFAFAVSAIPTQALEAKAIEGRWRTLNGQGILDIGRCGQDYCGQHVNLQNQNGPEGACGRTVLKVKLGGSLDFEGELDLEDGNEPYPVSVHVSEDARILTVLGRKEKTPIWSRVIPLKLQMVRIGDATCLPPPSS